ncbi:hypothetical protein [Pseudoxanthomonas sp. UTMC 1351]|uniref:hypothetical protein n=1 Tax=Pseudoxanthomonas sp. UTMC 1351 TaxID=2695853 RepID=UPI0034CE7A74
MNCHALLCFEALDPTGATIFGSAEYFAALALIIIAWTIGDRRYRFHIQTARLPVRHLAFHTVAAVGVLTLATDIWRASGWPVPAGNLITPVAWQGLLGALFLAVILLWIVTAFLYPPRFNERNSRHFISVTYRATILGDQSELAHVADAIEQSARNIISIASRYHEAAPDSDRERLSCGVGMLQVMTDPGFCHAAVKAAPGTLHNLFEALHTHTKAAPSMAPLARNVLAAAVKEKKSFLHRETSDWRSGLAAHTQPLSRCIFGNIDTLDRLQHTFSIPNAVDWDADEWEAYLRASGHAFSSYVSRTRPTHSRTIADIFFTLESATRRLQRLNGTSDLLLESDDVRCAKGLLTFIREVSLELAKGPVSVSQWGELNEYENPIQRLADLACKLLFDASGVKAPNDTSWWIQHNTVWTVIFDRHTGDAEPVMAEVRERVARMLWSKISELDYFPNYVGARLLGLCLNIGWVRGRGKGKGRFGSRPERAILRLASAWTVRRFDWLYRYHGSLAVSGFSEAVTYDPGTYKLRRAWEPIATRPQLTFTELAVTKAPEGPAEDHLLTRDKWPEETTSRKRRVPSSWSP